MVKVPVQIRRRLEAVVAKRPKTVIQHLLAHGSVTSQELTRLYGYEHPPRAIRDVRELGIPIETFKAKDTGGKTIAAYRFGNLRQWKGLPSKSAGRNQLARLLKQTLIDHFGPRCAVYLERMDASQLQVDHRVPYEIAGETDVSQPDNFMLLSPSANRAKSWSCEHCENWTRKDPAFCIRCFWAHPDNYDHVAGKSIRQISLMFTGNEVKDYSELMRIAGRESAQAVIKRILHKHLQKENKNE